MNKNLTNYLFLLLITGMFTPLITLAHDEIPDITGYWSGLRHEEYRIRLYGPEPGEIEGLPLNYKAKEAALNFDPNYYYKPENQCRKHGGAYVMRGPFTRHFHYEDENTLAIRMELEAHTRRIYMDGRPPPSEEHTNLGHSVGKWENGILKVTTTHMTPYFHRRNGVPYSENAVMTEDFILHEHGDEQYITLVVKVDDPEYLTETLVRSLDYKKEPDSYAKKFYYEYECEVVDWEGGEPGGMAD
jgi:hypothetical protein